jgi:hypothetical protein
MSRYRALSYVMGDPAWVRKLVVGGFLMSFPTGVADVGGRRDRGVGALDGRVGDDVLGARPRRAPRVADPAHGAVLDAALQPAPVPAWQGSGWRA